MLFSSWEFVFLFLPVVVSVFFLIPARPTWSRKIWLLAASLFFYGYWRVDYVPLLLLSIICNYTVAELITRYRHHRAARTVFIAGITFNLLLLGYYKYANFFLSCFGHIAQRDFGQFEVILPLAISFFTLTQIAYLVDVFRKQSLHYRFLDYALFVVLFPHLIAGPIVRHWEIIPQFVRSPLRAKLTDGSVGIALFLIGLFKKVLLADPLSNYVAAIYGAAATGMTVTLFDAWLGTLAFALQIYFDFSGYSDMAIGLVRLFGIKFPMNFDSPYQAGSIIEFWSRWHITLTRFLREYVYFPLGGNRRGPGRQTLNIMLTMLLSGLWHGAGWTYVIWGALHGFYIVIAHQWHRFTRWRGWRLDYWWYRFPSIALTFLAVLFAWVLFRASTFAAARQILSSMLGQHGLTIPDDLARLSKIPASLWANLGVIPVPRAFHIQSYTSLLALVSGMLIIALVLPNSQQMLAAYDPVLEPIRRPGLCRVKLGWPAGLLFGGGFFLVLRSFYIAAPSPFLYFKF